MSLLTQSEGNENLMLLIFYTIALRLLIVLTTV